MVLHRDVSKLSAERLFLHTARLNEKCPRQQQQGRPPPEVLWVTQTMGESLLQITTVANQSPATCSSMFGAGQSLTQANINCSEVLWPCRVFFSPKKLVFHNSLKLWQERKTSVYWIIMRKWQPSLREQDRWRDAAVSAEYVTGCYIGFLSITVQYLFRISPCAV